MEPIKNLINDLINNDKTNTDDYFKQAINNKIKERLEIIKKEVANKFFNIPDDSVDDEIDDTDEDNVKSINLDTEEELA